MVIVFVMVSIAMLAVTVNASENVKMTGVVAVDDTGDPVMTVSGTTYILDGNVGSYVGKKVVVTGVIETGEDGLKYIVVDTVESAS